MKETNKVTFGFLYKIILSEGCRGKYKSVIKCSGQS